MTITRVTQFKIPDAGHRQQLLDMYKTMQKDALKDGKQFILSLQAGSTFEDPRRQDYTLAVVTQFATLDDMEFYDTTCEAHLKLKAVAKPLIQGMMTSFFEPIATSSD